MIEKLRKTLNDYETLLDKLKDKVNSINALKLSHNVSLIEEEPSEVGKRSRQLNGDEVRENALDMAHNLMSRDKISKLKASKIIGNEIGIKPRTIYSWLEKEKN